MIKPARALRLLGYVGILLVVALYVLPTEWKLTPSLTFRSFTVRSIFEKQTAQYADISDITQRFDSPEDSVFVAPTVNQKPGRSRKAAKLTQDSLQARYRIQYGEGADTALHAFFGSLRALRGNHKLIRVLHYGDSQLEGDRITAFLRRKLQDRFGGCGVGLLPLFDPLGSRASVTVQSGFPWQKFFVYGNGYNKANPNFYGVLGSYYKYSFQYRVEAPDSVPKNDTLPAGPTYAYKDWLDVSVNLRRNRTAGALEGKVEKIKLLYRNPDAPFDLTIRAGTDTLRSVKIKADSSAVCRVFEQPFRPRFEHVNISFGSRRSPEFFGLALDCNRGVAVDNISFRGSSGVDFTRMNRQLLASQFKTLGVKLIILQFGVNVVPHEIEDYAYYERQFYNQLQLLKTLVPKVSILVVGVSDVSRKEGEFYVSYPNVEKIRDAQRRAAFRAGCAFWDLYEAMGGKNSMPSWVFAKPALANKDFTHFTPKGAQLVSEMLYKAIISEYEKPSSL